MATKKQLAEILRERLADVAERGRVLGQALRVRTDMAATRRRLRANLAELGEEVHARLKAGQVEGLAADIKITAMQEQIDGLKAQLKLQEMELREIMQSGVRSRAEKGAQAAAGPLRPEIERGE